MGDIMKRIKDYEDYSVTECGKVWSHKTNKYLKQDITKAGYCRVGLCKNGSKYNLLVHRLVSAAFIKGDMVLQVNHIDGNKVNNHRDNLEWSTRSNNLLHARDTKGMRLGRQKLILKDVHEIKHLLECGLFSQKEIGVMYKVHQNTISYIKKGKSWSNNYLEGVRRG